MSINRMYANSLKDIPLSNQNIDAASMLAENFLSVAKVERKDILRIKLAAEETLLQYQQRFGEDCCFSVQCVKLFGRLRLEFSIAGAPIDPFGDEDDTSGEILRSITTGMGIAPLWRYKNGKNLIVFMPNKKKPSQIVTLIASIVLALVCGALCSLLPQESRLTLSGAVVTPLFNTFLGLLNAIAGPMIFLSITWGIYSIGDTATLGRIGKKMISRFLGMSFFAALLVVLVYLPFFPLTGSSGGSLNLTDLYKMILDIVPSNFFTPFTEGNPMQIIFVSIVFGLSLLVLGSKTTAVATLVEQINYIVQLIMSTLSELIPLFVFLSIFNMILSGSFSVLLESYKLLPMFLLGVAVLMVFYTLLVCIRKRVSPAMLLKKLLPTFLIGLSTASSAAAFQMNLDTCEQKLGIDGKLVQFGVPLGQVVFMPGAVVEYLAVALCMGEVYKLPISPSWLITAWLISVLLSVASPPVPGGSFTCYTIIVVQLGIAVESLAVIIAFGVISDFVSTASNLFMLQTEMVELAGSLDMLAKDTLRHTE